jgi:hypothetical protein
VSVAYNAPAYPRSWTLQQQTKVSDVIAEEASMHRLLRVTAPVLLVIAATTVELAAQAADPVIGTWELNVAKSKYSAGRAVKSETRTYAPAGKDIKVTSKGVDDAGKPTSQSWTLSYDGKDRPQTGSPDADTLSVKRIDAHHAEFTQKRAGKAVITGTRTISPDGKVMTITSKGTNRAGQTIDNVEVYEKR